MFSWPLMQPARVYLHREAIDFRIGIHGLADPRSNRRCIWIRSAAQCSPSATGATGSGFCFDRSGFWLMMKRLGLIALRGRVDGNGR